ncbi:MAG TPA: hypothetical protein VGK41_05560 [Solirubrobacterales bacterium]
MSPVQMAGAGVLVMLLILILLLAGLPGPNDPPGSKHTPPWLLVIGIVGFLAAAIVFGIVVGENHARLNPSPPPPPQSRPNIRPLTGTQLVGWPPWESSDSTALAQR